MRSKTMWAWLAAGTLLAGACGGSSGAAGDPPAEQSPAGTGGEGTGETGGGRGPGEAGSPAAAGGTPTTATAAAPGGPAPGGPGSKGGSTASTADSDKPLTPVEMTLGSRCVRAGDRQTITLKTLPNGGVWYNSYYPDGISGIDSKFYGGNNGAVVDASGTWTDTWVIAAHAPPGEVRLMYGATKVGYRTHDAQTTFTLVPPGGTCP